MKGCSRSMKIAVLGTGSIGMRHLGVIRDLGLGAVAVPIRKEREQTLKSGGWDTASSMEQARDMGAVAAVIATDTSRHVRDAETALGLGLSVLCEKPLAPTAAEALSLRAWSRPGAPVTAVGCCLRFDEGLRRLRDRLGDIGPLSSVRIECRSYLPDWRPDTDFRRSYSARAGEGGVLRDLIHEVDYALWLFGEPRAVSGRILNRGILGIQSEEQAEGIWESPSGAMVSVGLDYLSRMPERFVRVSGDSGEIRYDFIQRKMTIRTPRQSENEELISSLISDTYKEQLMEFLGSIAGETASRLATLEEGIRALAVCDAWRMSSEEGRFVEVGK